MPKNAGKIFEDDIKKSCQRDDIFIDRVRDNATSYFDVDKIESLYSKENPYDFHIYKYPNLMCAECKYTKHVSMSIQQDPNEKNKMIKMHQIKALTKASEFDGVKAGFLFCFYNEKTDQEATYYMPVQNFNKFLKSTNKKSINIIDVVTYGCVKVDQMKLRTHYHYDIKELFNKI